MKSFRANTIPELRSFKGIKIEDIKEVINQQTYYNWIQGKTDPFSPKADKECLVKFCELFEIDEKTFKRLLKNTLNNKN